MEYGPDYIKGGVRSTLIGQEETFKLYLVASESEAELLDRPAIVVIAITESGG